MTIQASRPGFMWLSSTNLHLSRARPAPDVVQHHDFAIRGVVNATQLLPFQVRPLHLGVRWPQTFCALLNAIGRPVTCLRTAGLSAQLQRWLYCHEASQGRQPYNKVSAQLQSVTSHILMFMACVPAAGFLSASSTSSTVLFSPPSDTRLGSPVIEALFFLNDAKNRGL